MERGRRQRQMERGNEEWRSGIKWFGMGREGNREQGEKEEGRDREVGVEDREGSVEERRKKNQWNKGRSWWRKRENRVEE